MAENRTIGGVPTCPSCKQSVMVVVAKQELTTTVECPCCLFRALVNPRTGTWLRLRKGVPADS